MLGTRTSLGLIYASLIGLRIYSASSGYAYIHPDEWFQSGEALAGDLFGLQTSKTWEFDPAFPCRSVASIRLANLPLLIYAVLIRQSNAAEAPSGRTLFAIQRLTFLATSFALHFVTFMLSPENRFLSTLCLLAASSAILTFQVRPFSNSVEAVVLALSLLTYHRFQTSSRSRLNLARLFYSLVLGILASIGLFARFTFLLFFLPIGVAFLYSIKTSARKQGLSSRLAALVAAAAGFVLTSAAHITYDSHYYSDPGLSSQLIVTPVNAFLYNVRPRNVATHGVHPRWLHAVVNYPLMVGVATVLTLLQAAFRRLSRKQQKGQGRKPQAKQAGPSSSLLVATIVTPILGLSISPHQEPRFLLPLLVPSILLFSRALHAPNASRSWRRTVLVLFVLQQVPQVIFFGFAHQGGLVPALVHLDRHVLPFVSPCPSGKTRIVFWRTFMVPRHLMPSASDTDVQQCVELVHADAMPALQVYNLVQPTDEAYRETLLVAPTWAALDLERVSAGSSPSLQEQQRQIHDPTTTLLGLTRVQTWTPHLDMDHVPEMVRAVKRRGWRQGLGLQLYRIAA